MTLAVASMAAYAVPGALRWRHPSENPAAERGREGDILSDRGRPEVIDERREPPDNRKAGDRTPGSPVYK